MATLDAFREFVAQIELFDNHEHLLPESDWVATPAEQVDFSHFFSHYASVDVVSAGLSSRDLEAIRSEPLPLEEKWRLFEPCWERARNTAYCRAVEMAIRDLLGLPGLNRDTYREVSCRLRDRQHPGWHRRVLKEKARIYRSVINIGHTDVDRELFAPVISFDDFALVRPEHLDTIQTASGYEINSLSTLTGALNSVFQQRVSEGIVGVKIALAYSRTLGVEDPQRAKAEEVLQKILSRSGHLPRTESKLLEDYMIHQIIQLAVEHHLPIQIHTGIQEGNGNYLSWTNPTLLSGIFMRYPDARFDVFHAGYPYCYELGVLAKMFPGVYPDLCWTHIITPLGARRALSEWLELLPATKIFGFGGDYLFVEGIYAHAEFARENVACVLAQKVDEGYFTRKEAEHIAFRILRDNGREFFGL